MPVVGSHERLYREYRSVERVWRATNPERENDARGCFRRIVAAGIDESVAATELAYFRIEVPGWEDARRLRGELAALGDGPICEDVYEAALVMLRVGGNEWAPNEDLELVFRGQRNADWHVVPSLFRAGSAQLEDQLHALGDAVRFLQARLGDLTDLEAVALAQHYSLEAGVKTWLLDFTWDPLVALFFASDGGVDGEVGVVQKLVRAEWDDLSAGGTNRLGALRVVTVPATRRIAAQRALFIDTSHPDFFDQIVPYEIRFRQHTGLVFEDEAHDVPVSRDALYPPSDEVLDLLPVEATRGEPLAVAPAGDAAAALGGDDYLAIATSWLDVTLDPYRRDALAGACEIHARMQERRDLFATPNRNLHRLRDAAHRLAQATEAGEYPTPARLLELNTWSMDDKQRAAFDELVAEVGR